MKQITNKEELTKEQESINLGNWLISLGEYIKDNPLLIVESTLEYQPIGNILLNSPISYENACKILFSLTKKRADEI